MPHFDWTISFGTLLQATLVMSTLYHMIRSLWIKIERRLLAMEHRVDVMWAWTLSAMTADQRNNFEVFYRQWRDHMKEDLN